MAAATQPAATRSFDKRLYDNSALEEAMEAYAPFATLTVDRSGDAWTVDFANVDEEVGAELLASEFANYVLAQTIERKR